MKGLLVMFFSLFRMAISLAISSPHHFNMVAWMAFFKPLVIQQKKKEKTLHVEPLLLSETLHNCEVSCLERIHTHTQTPISSWGQTFTDTNGHFRAQFILNLQPTIQRSIVAEVRERAVDKTIYTPPYPIQLTNIIFKCVHDICISKTIIHALIQ